MRTQKEIIDRFNSVSGDDYLGFETCVLAEWLTYESVKELGVLVEGTTEKEWDKLYKEPTYENVLKRMKDYISFAYDKARGHRGISAYRSLAHYKSWVWLLDDGFSEEFDRMVERYTGYGIPILDKLNERYNLLEEENG